MKPAGRNIALSLLACGLLLAGALAGCGEEHETEVVEGEPLELGALSFNVQFTRFLNPHDREDSEYLDDMPPAPAGQEYFGVFMRVENDGEEPVSLPPASGFEIVDTTGASYPARRSPGLFGLDFGQQLAPGDELPLPDTAAAAGPIKGAMVLFLVDPVIAENRPIELEISSGGEHGLVELDI